MPDRMNLVLFHTPTGRAGSAWRSPTTPVEELYGPDLPIRIAQRAEEARFDALFIANVLFGTGDGLGKAPFSTGYEPFTLMGLLAGVTERIGLIGTASPTFIHPYNLARFLGSLDHLTKGRVGWNAVAASTGSAHFGREHPPKEERYARLQEALDLAEELWDVFADDAVIADREAGVWADPEKVHPVKFAGKYYSSEGHLFQHRSPQGRPVVVQAGQSPTGIDFAARNAEVVFTAQTDLDLAREYYREIKGRAAAAGRDPGSVRVLPGFTPVIAESAKAVEALEQQLDALIDVETSLKDGQVALQTDLSGLELDAQIPPELLRAPEDMPADWVGGSRYRNHYEAIVNRGMTLRRFLASIDRRLGHLYLAGTAGQSADLMQEWFEGGACDGFALTPVTIPEGLDTVCDQLLPELRRRGLARTEYEGTTLREHLGLARPAAVHGG
jgi:FMN-dependent oxidoreductase (nitrilotriacetate monooxygenase family)